MNTYSFFAKIHLDRFADLAMVIGPNMVIVEPWSVGNDNTVEVHIRGEAAITRKLDQSLQKIKHILSVAPVVEEV